MLKLYDKQMNFIKTIAEYSELQITEELNTGYKVAQFQLPYEVGLVQEEQKIEINDYLYVVKEVNMEDNDYYEVFCKPYWGKLLGKHIDSLTGYSYSLQTCLDEVLAETDWTYKFEQAVSGVYTVKIERKSALDAIAALKQLYNVDFAFDTKNKVIHIWNTRGEYKETFFFNETNLRQCKVQSNTYDLITRLIPIGKNGAAINLVNGSMWVENYDYTDEVIVGYWVNSSVENADDLLKLAQDKIEIYSKPQTTYKINITALHSSLAVGDKIRVIDEIKGVDRVERIAKIVHYPTREEESYVELGNPLVSFDNIYKSMQEAQKAVNEDTLRNLTEINKLYS